MRKTNQKMLGLLLVLSVFACKKEELAKPEAKKFASISEKVSAVNTASSVSISSLKGDGTTDNRAALQSLVNSYAAQKKVLVLPAGRFAISNEVLLPSNISIEGAGDKTEIFLNTNPGANRKVLRVPTRINNVSLKNLKLNANQSVNTGAYLVSYYVTDNTTNIYAENVTFAGGRNGGSVQVKGLNAYQVKNLSFINCRFIEAGATSLELRGCNAALITGCTFENWGTVNPNSPSLQLQSQDNISIKIVKNTFNNTKGVQFAIECAAAYVVNSLISENTLNDPKHLGGNGISGYFRNTEISKNQMIGGKGTHRSGMEIFGTYNTLSYNNITAGSIAISCGKTEEATGVVIANNTVKTKGANVGGVQLGGGGHNLNNIKIINNTIDTRASSGNSSAIVLGIYNGQRAVSNITIENNVIYTNAHGIRMQSLPGSKDIFILKNTFKTAYTWIGVITNTFSNVQAKGNIIEFANKTISYSNGSIAKINAQ